VTVHATCVTQSGGIVYQWPRSLLQFQSDPGTSLGGHHSPQTDVWRRMNWYMNTGLMTWIVAFGDSFAEGRVSPWGSYAADDGRFDRKKKKDPQRHSYWAGAII